MAVLQTILAPRETVNDETVFVTALFVKDGDLIVHDAPLIDVETSKAVVAIHAETEGYAKVHCAVGDEVPIGGILLEILDTAAAEPAGPSGVAAALPGAESTPDAPVFSRRAAELMAAHQVPPDRFARHDFVLARDVQALLGNDLPRDAAPSVPVVPRQGRPPEIEPDLVEVEPLSRTKKTEIRYLADIQSSGLTSTAAVSIDAGEIYRALAGYESLFDRSLLPLLCYEASRLLKKYRALNACFLEDRIAFYKAVNVGVAVDMEKGLKVLTVYGADEQSLQAIDRTIFDLVDRYCEDRLETTDTSHSTFTITDLSAFGVDFFVPLVNARQSAILGVSALEEATGRLCLTLTFDHRVTDGKTAGLFLSELKARVESYAAAGSRHTGVICAICLKSLDEDARLGGGGLVQRVNHRGEIDHLCIVCLRGGV